MLKVNTVKLLSTVQNCSIFESHNPSKVAYSKEKYAYAIKEIIDRNNSYWLEWMSKTLNLIK